MSHRIRSSDDIPGYFTSLDRRMFQALLESQEVAPTAHLVEIGSFLGRSAVIIGEFKRAGERFVVVDPFDQPQDQNRSDGGLSAANVREIETHYPGLSRARFEANYLAIHQELPEIVQAASVVVSTVLPPTTVRFHHIDGSHLYAVVRDDIANAKLLAAPGCIVAIDDIRARHTPGVWAAAWEATLNYGLIPIAISPQKLYAVYDERWVQRYHSAIIAMADADPTIWVEEQAIFERRVLRVDELALPAWKILFQEALQQGRAVLRGRLTHLYTSANARMRHLRLG